MYRTSQALTLHRNWINAPESPSDINNQPLIFIMIIKHPPHPLSTWNAIQYFYSAIRVCGRCIICINQHKLRTGCCLRSGFVRGYKSFRACSGPQQFRCVRVELCREVLYMEWLRSRGSFLGWKLRVRQSTNGQSKHLIVQLIYGAVWILRSRKYHSQACQGRCNGLILSLRGGNALQARLFVNYRKKSFFICEQ